MKKAHSRNHDRAMLGFAACFAAVAITAFPGNSTDRPTEANTALRREAPPASPRVRLLIDDDWRFTRGDPPNTTTALDYDVRPQVTGRGGAPAAPVSAGPAVVAKPWILPTANSFLKDPQKRSKQPDTNLGVDVPYVATAYNDASWQKINLPHDYAIEGPFTTSVSGSTGRLNSSGVVWYRKNLTLPASDAGKSIFLDIDGAMAYRLTIANDGKDLSFITLTVADKNSQMVPRSMNLIHFGVSGPGEIVATDNGDPTDMTSFPSKDRKAFNGLALAIIRARRGQSGQITVVATSERLEQARTRVAAK